MRKLTDQLIDIAHRHCRIESEIGKDADITPTIGMEAMSITATVSVSRQEPVPKRRSKKSQAPSTALELQDEPIAYPRIHSAQALTAEALGGLGASLADLPKISILDLRSECASRPVDWRWQLATRIATKLKVPSPWRDSDISAAAKLQTRLVSDTAKDRHYIERTMPLLMEAHFLRFRSPVRQRLEIEARILAGEDFGTIGKKTAVDPTVLEKYQSLFFDVSDRLKDPSYIMNVAIGARVHGNWTDDDIPSIAWKLFGYHGGPHVLDALIYGRTSTDRPSSPAAVAAFQSTSIAGQFNVGAGIATRMIDFRIPRNSKKLLRWFMNSTASERQKAKLKGFDFEPNMRAFNEQVAVLTTPGVRKPQPSGR